MNYDRRFMADTLSSVHTEEEPLRDSDLLVLTVCCYSRKINLKKEEEKKQRRKGGEKICLVFFIFQQSQG